MIATPAMPASVVPGTGEKNATTVTASKAYAYRGPYRFFSLAKSFLNWAIGQSRYFRDNAQPNLISCTHSTVLERVFTAAVRSVS